MTQWPLGGSKDVSSQTDPFLVHIDLRGPGGESKRALCVNKGENPQEKFPTVINRNPLAATLIGTVTHSASPFPLSCSRQLPVHFQRVHHCTISPSTMFKKSDMDQNLILLDICGLILHCHASHIVITQM